MSPEPIACSLSGSELTARRESLLARVGAAVVAHEWLPTGLKLELAESAAVVADVLELVQAEHHCCRFLHFRLEIGPGAAPITLELTGPPGTVEFLAPLGLVEVRAGLSSVSRSEPAPQTMGQRKQI